MPIPSFESILVLDIETVPVVQHYDMLPAAMQQEWKKKADRIYNNEAATPAESFAKYAGIYAEFGKVICISVGKYVAVKKEVKQLVIHSFWGDDEKKILTDFSKFISKRKNFSQLAGHNIREFDVPYLCRRMLVNQVQTPSLLNISGKRPFELDFMIDTLQLWKFGDYKHYTSLNLLCSLFDIPTSKTDLDGSKVADAYWLKNDLAAIKKYCEQDIVAVAQLVLKFNQLPMIEENEVQFLVS